MPAENIRQFLPRTEVQPPADTGVPWPWVDRLVVLGVELQAYRTYQVMMLATRSPEPSDQHLQLLHRLRAVLGPVPVNINLHDEIVARVEHEQALLAHLTANTGERRLIVVVVLPRRRWVFDANLAGADEGEVVDAVTNFGWEQGKSRAFHLDGNGGSFLWPLEVLTKPNDDVLPFKR